MNRPLIALLAALFAGGVAAAPARALLPVYVESVLAQPPLLTSTLLSIQLACGGLFALAGGAVSDLVSRRMAVLVGLTTGLFGAALFVVRDPALLFAVAALWGVAGGFQSAGGQSFLMATVSQARLGSATAVYFVAGTASGAVGAYLAGQAAVRWGFWVVAGGAALLALVALALAAIFLPPLGGDAAPPGDRASAGPLASTAASSWPRTQQRSGRMELFSRFGRSVRAWGGYRNLLRRPDVLALVALRYLPTVAWGAAGLAIPLLLFRLSGDVSTVGLFSMVSLLAASGAQLATGRQIDRLSRHARGRPAGSPGGSPRRLICPLTAAILLSAVSAALLSRNLPGLFVAGVAWAMSAWALSTTMPPLIHELGCGRDDGRLIALTHLLWSAGMLSGTVGAGALVDVDPAAPFVLAVICLAITLLVGLRFARLLPANA